MKYNELVQFEPIESVVQLRNSDKLSEARRLVETFVISEDLSEKLIEIVIPQIQFDRPADNKGLMVVGNYGTGKSHLLSVISAIAEDAKHLKFLQNTDVASEAKVIGGKFKVIRIEIGATEMSLRRIIVKEIEQNLKLLNVNFNFPAADDVPNNKSAFEDLMTSFHEVYPDFGLFVVVDELLDFLRSRKDVGLITDLNFLREIGEVCKDLRFRFIAGVQEAIIDSTRFEFANDSIRRVKDRFEQLIISRNDIKFVVAERLLKKTEEQKLKIEQYLLKYNKFYDRMLERKDEFVKLFPVHPEFVNIFDQISIIEKREILKVLSQEMTLLLDQKIPEDYPKLITFDNYWNNLTSNPTFRTSPGIKEVIDCSQVLENRIKEALTYPEYKPMALRIIHALSIHRLTTVDISTKIGISALELRDGLCLWEPEIESLGGNPADDLLTHVETVLSEILRTVSGQFISSNPENGQYYLDLKKTEDFDAQIKERAEALEKSDLDRYFFVALRRIMECTDQTYVSDYQIWQHELEWTDHKTTRLGYLFFGSPNERSTAVPQRDFYLYFVKPFDPPKLESDVKSDEVIFELKNYDDTFYSAVLNYGASIKLANISSGAKQEQYHSKARQFLDEISNWLQNNLLSAFQVTYLKTSEPLSDYISNRKIQLESDTVNSGEFNFRDLIRDISSSCLSSNFNEQAPNYPRFSVLITESNRNSAILEALRTILGQNPTKHAKAILDALEITKDNKITPSSSNFAQFILSKLDRKGQGQVVNRNELIQDLAGVEYMDPSGMRLEPEWVVVLLTSLIYSGDIVLEFSDKKIDATNLEEMLGKDLNKLTKFSRIRKPKDWNINEMRSLFELFDLPTGLAQLIVQGKVEPIQQIQSKIIILIKDLIDQQQYLSRGTNFWGQDLLTEDELRKSSEQISITKLLLESLQKFDSSGKFKNFSAEKSQITNIGNGLKYLRKIDLIRSAELEFGELVRYFTSAEMAFSSESEWKIELEKIKTNLLDYIKNEGMNENVRSGQSIKTKLVDLKSNYIDTYFELHKAVRLDQSGEETKFRLMKDVRLETLKILSAIDLMPIQQLNEFIENLMGLQSCKFLTKKELEAHPTCPHCNFSPNNESYRQSVSAALIAMDEQLNKVLKDWTQLLIIELSSPEIETKMKLLDSASKKLIKNFLSSKNLPNKITDKFIKTINEVFSDLKKVSINIEELEKALILDGTPVTPIELKKRFDNYLDLMIKGAESQDIRIAINQG